MRYILILSILLLNFIVCNANPSLFDYSSSSRDLSELKGVIGLMVQFEAEDSDNPLTSGNGQFLIADVCISEDCSDPDNLQEGIDFIEHNGTNGFQGIDIGFIDNDDINRCSETLLDPPPHNTAYFTSQISATKNYFNTISNGNIDFDFEMIPITYQLDNDMESYAQSEDDITRLYIDAVLIAENEIVQIVEDNFWNSEDFIVVVFHAGLGQDLGAPLFDPTIFDIHSAYIEQDMISSMDNEYHYPECNNGECELGPYLVTNGILLPETLNEIYYDVIEDIHPISFVDEEDLENIYCDYQLGMTGLFSYFLGYRLGLPVMHSTENIQPVTRIGKFGLMDYGAYNGRGIVPALPHVWSRINHPNINVTIIDKTADLFNDEDQSIDIVISYDIGNTIYKIKITENEYFLIENRNNKIINNPIFDVLDEDEYTLDDLSYYLNCDPINPNTEETSLHCDESVQNDLRELFGEPNVGENYYWLDIVTKLFNCDGCSFLNETTNVIENFENYDYGLPGSGLLIWHIREPNQYEINNGMNNDINNKAIHLEEADGMNNIGFPDPNPFGSPLPTGWQYDYWFRGNSYYEEINNSEDNILFNQSSIPNSNAYGGTASNVSIEINSNNNTSMTITLSYENDDIEIIDDTAFDIIRHLGNNNGGVIYYSLVDTTNNIDTWYSKDYTDLGSITHLINSDFISSDDPFVLGCKDFDDLNIYDDVDDIILSSDEGLCIVENESNYLSEYEGTDPDAILEVRDDYIEPIGYLNSSSLDGSEEPQSISTSNNTQYALGDLDNDGLDEIVSVSDGVLTTMEYNGLILSGFPVDLNFNGIPLISDINNDFIPEIICKTEHSIAIISANGELIEELPLYNSDEHIYLVPKNNSNNSGNGSLTTDIPLLLINGNRMIEFNATRYYQYWMNPYSQINNYPLVGLERSIRYSRYNNWSLQNENSDFGIDLDKVFNYPNPFENETKFRFFVGSSNSVVIKIYNMRGYLLDKFTVGSLDNYQFNEYFYDTSKFDPGVYIAEIKSDKKESKVLKLLKTK